MSAKQPSKRKRKSDDDRRALGRLERILLLVPYCMRHPGVSLGELATRFGATREELLEDLELVFMCGLPDYTPADLIEVSVEGDRVWIGMADYFSKPLRLTRTEAIPLYVKARALLGLLKGRNGGGGVPGLEELGPLDSALNKLGRALLPQDGGVAELSERIKVHLEAGESQFLPLLRDAVTNHTRVRMEYYSYSRDTLTLRDVDPYLVFSSLGHWYMSGHCHLAADRRMFRLDRIKSLEPTAEAFDPPADVSEDMPPPLVVEPEPEDRIVRLRVSARVAPWLTEFLPIESSTELPRGRRELTFRTSQFAWLEKSVLLRFGSDVEVLDPSELRDQVRESAKRMLQLYRGGSGGAVLPPRLNRENADTGLSLARATLAAMIGYLDIETSYAGEVTVVGLLRLDRGLLQLVSPAITRATVLDCLDGIDTVCTFNGDRFDLPILGRAVDVELFIDYRSLDLSVECRKLNIRGGLKGIEMVLGISRGSNGLNGLDALVLWEQWQQGDRASLDTLLAYNADDVVNLVSLERKLHGDLAPVCTPLHTVVGA